MVEMFNSFVKRTKTLETGMRCKLDLVNGNQRCCRETCQVVFCLAFPKCPVSYRLRCPLLVSVRPNNSARTNWNWSIHEYTLHDIVTCMQSVWFVNFFLLFFISISNLNQYRSACCCFNTFFFHLEVYKESERRGSLRYVKKRKEKEERKKSDVLTFALLAQRSRENLVKSSLMRDTDRAQVFNEKVMEPLCAPCFAQGGTQLVPGLSNFQCNWYTKKISRVFERGFLGL